jgi:hypothetical protein
MDILELFYIALGTIGVLIVLHLGTFWVARIIKPPAPKIVYVRDPTPVAPPPVAAPPPPPPPQVLSEAPSTIQLPTYDTPPAKAVPQLGTLPPPLETRNTTKQSGGDIGAPR